MKLPDHRRASKVSGPLRALTLAAGCALACSAWAQAPGVLLPDDAAPQPKSLLGRTALSGLKLNMSGFAIEGNVLIDQEGLARTLEPWLNRELDLAAFEQAVHAVSQFLRANGHPDVVVKISRAMMRDGQLAVAIEGLSPRSVDYARAPASEPVLPVKGFRFKGVSKATPRELEEAVAPWTGRPLKVAELQAPADAVAQVLRAKGYTLAQAFLPPQKLQDGMLEIEVQEGLVDTSAGKGGIVVTGPQDRIRAEAIENMLGRAVTAGQPLLPSELETRLLLANELPGAKVTADLEPGQQPGTTQIMARMESSPLASGQVTADSYGNRYTGLGRGQVALNLNSLTGWGDQLQMQGTTSAQQNAGRLGWTFPLGWDGARAGLAYSTSDLKLNTQVVPVNLDGRVRASTAFFSYPWLQGSSRRLTLQGSYESRRLSNTLDTLPLNERQVDVMNLSLTGESVGGVFDNQSWNIGISSGQVENRYDLGGALQRADTAGRYNKLNAGFQFQQALSPLGEGSRWRWQVGVTGQYATRNLDTSEKFQLGGPMGVRSYPVGEAFGDEGALLNVELHRDLGVSAIGAGSMFGFFDSGMVRLSRSPWAAQLATGKPNAYQLHGMGLGVALNPGPQSLLKLMWAHKVGTNPNLTAANTDSDGSTSSSRIWLLGTYRF